MLAVKKQDPEQIDSRSTLAGGFGKVLGSVQGLQQRLGDFSYGEVSIAEAKVKMLIKQMTLLRENLDGLAQLKFEFGETDRRVREIPEHNFDDVTYDSLEKHPQLHAILQASKWISLPEGTQTKPQSLASTRIKPSTDRPIDQPPTGGKSAVQPITPPQIGSEAAFQGVEKRSATKPPLRKTGGSAEYDDKTSINKAVTDSQKNLTFTIPSEEVTGSIAMGLNGRRKDWSFDAQETPLTQSEASTTALAFEFPAETVDDPKFPVKTKPTRTSEHTATPNRLSIKPTAASQRTTTPDSKANTHFVKTIPEPKLDDSKALVPANHNFDQRLLEDVIKSYGDFASTPNLPAPLMGNSTPVVPVMEPTVKTTKADTADPIDKARKVLNDKKSGDLDRQLKKIIKDYGEYDIYERKRVISFRAGGVIAFVVLGVVLTMLYLLKPTGTVPTPQPVATPQHQFKEATQPTQADKTSSAVEGVRADTDAVNSSADKLNENQQKP